MHYIKVQNSLNIFVGACFGDAKAHSAAATGVVTSGIVAAVTVVVLLEQSWPPPPPLWPTSWLARLLLLSFVLHFVVTKQKRARIARRCCRINTVSHVSSGSVKSNLFFPVRLYAKRHACHDTKGPHTGACSSYVTSVVA